MIRLELLDNARGLAAAKGVNGPPAENSLNLLVAEICERLRPVIANEGLPPTCPVASSSAEAYSLPPFNLALALEARSLTAC